MYHESSIYFVDTTGRTSPPPSTSRFCQALSAPEVATRRYLPARRFLCRAAFTAPLPFISILLPACASHGIFNLTRVRRRHRHNEATRSTIDSRDCFSCFSHFCSQIHPAPSRRSRNRNVRCYALYSTLSSYIYIYIYAQQAK